MKIYETISGEVNISGKNTLLLTRNWPSFQNQGVDLEKKGVHLVNWEIRNTVGYLGGGLLDAIYWRAAATIHAIKFIWRGRP